MELGGKFNKSTFYTAAREVDLCLQVGVSFALCVVRREGLASLFLSFCLVCFPQGEGENTPAKEMNLGCE